MYRNINVQKQISRCVREKKLSSHRNWTCRKRLADCFSLLRCDVWHVARQFPSDRICAFECWTSCWTVCSAVMVHWTPTESDLAAQRSTTLVSLEDYRWNRVWVWEMIKGSSKNIFVSLNWIMVVFMSMGKKSHLTIHLLSLSTCDYLFNICPNYWQQ